jgi:hypothetical protein
MDKIHTISPEDVEAALSEVVLIYHQLISAPARNGSRKRLSYNPETKTYRIKTNCTEATCKTSDEAARLYNDK